MTPVPVAGGCRATGGWAEEPGESPVFRLSSIVGTVSEKPMIPHETDMSLQSVICGEGGRERPAGLLGAQMSIP